MTKKTTLESISSQIEKIAKKMEKGFFDLSEGIAELRGRTASLEEMQEEILEKIEPLSRAHDKDSERLIEDGRRLSHIEKHVGMGRS